MFALETPSSGLPFTTRSSLQALLKSRGAVSEQKRHAWIPMKEKVFPSNFALNCEEIDSLSQVIGNSPIPHPLQDSDLRNGDSNGDFSYSQKLFHIDDGNLYSIFSPLQGRSYGMKPSFLRKQKCTVQECHGRGRKIHRKGLKFHNFLPSESVTSEKDNNFHENRWKVHSECKLREEHGTKQIMVSNWSRNVSDVQENEEKCATSSNDSVTNHCPIIATPDGSMYDYPATSESNLFTMENDNDNLYNPSACNSESKYSFLNNLLHSVSKSQFLDSSCPKSEKATRETLSLNVHKHRRKPDQTRKVVPYTKYLSLIEEENESFPLDLSCHSHVSSVKVSDNDIIEHNSHTDFNSIESSVTETASDEKSISNDTLMNDSNHPIHFLHKVPTYLYPLPQQKVMPNSANIRHGSMPSKLNSLNQRMYDHSATKSKERRKSQRSVIKQKLEDTFRQNGFLVKTKQVSDGEATFCKFRQLRKYTRYYLKSWQQHLPDEVHKMWKGFLPPKTVLPPSSSIGRNDSSSVHRNEQSPADIS